MDAPIGPMSDTPCDKMCDVFIRGKAGEVLQQIVVAFFKTLDRCSFGKSAL
jgi:hypothetical protein